MSKKPKSKRGESPNYLLILAYYYIECNEDY